MSDNENKEVVENGVHNYSTEESYVWPEDEKVKEKLEWFRDQKFALMMHWGPYSQIGVVESWALSDEDGDWSRTEIDWADGEEFKKQYFDLNKTFNPIRFVPKDWAKAAKEAGFKYFIFTTKHHDGFCMWDTAYTDYKITGKDCPFNTNKRADILKHLFNEMRNEGIGITAYFSKADWHCPDYWCTGYEKGDKTWRGPSYDIEKHPEKWESFEKYTHNQVKELADNYGPIDAFWFDAGWVCEKEGENIHLGNLMDEIRKSHPGVLSVDRTVGGKYENYVTPEQCVPDEPLNIPWESCITMGTSFSFKYEDKYKSDREIITLLTNIVAKGGNLALNVGPQPDGRIPEGALKAMKNIGKWLSKYGEAIYGTRVCAPYKKEDVCFTQKAKEKKVYAIKQYPDENMEVKRDIFIPYEGKVAKVKDLYSGNEVRFENVPGGLNVHVNEVEEAAIAQVFELSL
ncbi:alpha-L-fucosidase [Butyrivibrio sp. WCE2006]|uniref:alpha-L-fucosidase n=1 Tax=Butyrivibrio sp. WCE2006 TaxID=1410611 RepID=UPI0005D2D092|nr:alpha-L-fucosidase [Butyrivibrio sp. WCE2006]